MDKYRPRWSEARRTWLEADLAEHYSHKPFEWENGVDDRFPVPCARGQFQLQYQRVQGYALLDVLS